MMVFPALRFELLLALKNGRHLGQALAFYALVPLVFHFALGDALNGVTGAGALWVAAILAQLLAADHFFRDDVRDGTLDQWRIMENGVGPVVVAKGVSAWLTVYLPMFLLSPILAAMCGVEGIRTLMLTFLVGSPALTCLTMAGAALTSVFARRGGLLMLICLPLLLPVLIFALGAFQQQNGSLWLLCGYTMFLTPLSLLITVAALNHAE